MKISHRGENLRLHLLVAVVKSIVLLIQIDDKIFYSPSTALPPEFLSGKCSVDLKTGRGTSFFSICLAR
jgi:hypothetical protein